MSDFPPLPSQRSPALASALKSVVMPNLAMVALILGAGALLGAVLTIGLGEAVFLGVLAALAAVGTFALFGWAAGYIRFSEHASDSELLRTLAVEADAAMQIVSHNDTVLFTNEAFRRLLVDVAGGNATGHGAATLEDALRWEPRAGEALFRLARAVKEGVRRDEDIPLGGRDGSQSPAARWLRVSVRPFPSSVWHREHGPLVLWLASDVTEERRKAQSETDGLKSLLARYDAMPLGLLAADESGVVTHMNPTLATWLGQPAPGALPAPQALAEILPADTVLLIKQILARGDGAGPALDIDLIRGDGSIQPVRMALQATAGGDKGFVAAFLDQSTDLALAGQPGESARFTRVTDAAPFGIATVAADGRIEHANAAFTRMFAQAERPPPRKLLDLAGGEAQADARRALEKAFARALEGKPATTPVDVGLGGRQELTRRIYVNPLSASDGARSVALYVVDTTEQKSLELKFAQSQKMEAVGKLAGGIAHDFNNVLQVIIGLTEMLLQSRRPTDPGYNDLQQIKSNGQRAAGMVSQLLAFSRKQTLEPEVLSLDEAIPDFIYSMLSRTVGEKVDIRHVPCRDLWHVKADRTQLSQVLLNLAVNARDAMPDGGSLTIRTSNVSERQSIELGRLGMAPGEYVQIEVTDSGTGMPPDVMAKIFEPFFSTKEVGKGTGLGLSTVYGIVKQTGGYIFPESQPGVGTTFRIYLPRHSITVEDEAAAAKGRKRKPVRDLTGTGTVLLVEDEDAVRNFAVRALKRQGYTVLEATSGVEALEVLAENAGKVDLVISDVIMPEMNGPEMYAEMRKTIPDLKIIFVSGYPSDAFEKSLDPDAEYDFLQKPFSLEKLADKVKERLAG